MAVDIGYRSVEINIENYTSANLSVQSANLIDSSEWIDAEQPHFNPNSILAQGRNILYGVKTSDDGNSAGFSISFSGIGDKPIIINAQNLLNGESSVSVVSNNLVMASVTQTDNGEDNHTQFQVILSHKVPPILG